MLWAEERVHGDVDAIDTPIGRIPRYEDLKRLFKSALDKDYTRDEYDAQFTIRTQAYRDKWNRMDAIFKNHDMPAAFSRELQAQIDRLAE